ncbi:MAG: M20/M25/M40 family metallo-hydrolase [Clostridiaceae bacterium]|nr:M20/M25/M40 family metallo-hydrolase [Clostridiaceae bacterium]
MNIELEDMSKEIEKLTKDLVSIGSVNGTAGEKEIAQFIENYLREIPYFKEHSDQIIIQELKGDKLNRRNVFAYIKGLNNNIGKTILLHGHMDTVGVEDFGNLQQSAFDCDVLLKKMLDMKLPSDVRHDLESNDWMVGRGACDMKSGVAVFLVLLKELSKKIEKLSGNIVLSINPVEENLHTGIIEGLDVLTMLKEKMGFKFLLAINNDYICPLYEGDTKRYIYMGAVGKLLPCFYVQGKETHVGQCFEGFDATKVASTIVNKINLNTDFCDGYEGEYTLPPTVLKMKDLKKEYNVQTAFDAFVYFNYFVHKENMESIIQKLRCIAEEAFNEVLKDINIQYKKYCELVKDNYHSLKYKVKVITYEELLKEAINEKGSEVLVEINKLGQKLLDENVDKREIGIYLIRYLLQELKEKGNVIVLYFAAPYCPHNTLKKENKAENKLYKEISSIINEFAEEEREEYKVMQFFPSLSDSSYIKIDDDVESIKSLIENFPVYDLLYQLPLMKVKALNIPALNYGCYGKDAHKWTERVYKPYSFKVLPKLILKTINYYL